MAHFPGHSSGKLQIPFMAAPQRCYNRNDSKRRNFRGTYYCFP